MKKIYTFFAAVLMTGMMIPAAASAQNRTGGSSSDGEDVSYGSNPNAIHLSKKAEKVKDIYSEAHDEYKITLEAFVEGKKNIHQVVEYKPVDIALVLDVSGSMGGPISSNAEYFAHPNARLAYNYTYVHPNGNKYGWVDDYAYYASPSAPSTAAQMSLYYYKYNGGYYPIKRISASSANALPYFGDKKAYMIYFETGEQDVIKNVKDGSETLQNKRYYIGKDGTAKYFTGWNIPVDEGSDSADENFYTSNPDDVNFRGTLYSSSRIDALRSAVEAFISIIEEDNNKLNEGTGYHRLGIAKFSEKYYDESNTPESPASELCEFDPHYLFIKDKAKLWNYSQIVSPLTYINDNEGVSAIGTAIDKFEAAGGTRTDFGLQCGADIFKNAADDGKERQKVLVLFTDGEPTDNTSGSSSFNNTVANSAIAKALELKQQGVTVFVVGLADASKSTYAKFKKFMEYVSSDYLEAESLDNGGKQSDTKYFSLARNGDELKSIFEGIAGQTAATEIGYKLTKDNQVVLDALTKHFMLPPDVNTTDAHTIKLYTSPFEGYDTDNNEIFGEWYGPLTKEKDGVDVSFGGENNREIIVSGFDFAGNWVGPINEYDEDDKLSSTTYHGNKLIIEIPFIVDPANPGGASVATNEAYSGIFNINEKTGKPDMYDNQGKPDASKAITTFDVPKLTMPNIVLIKEGMEPGDCAVFTVERVDENGEVMEGYKAYTLMAISDANRTAKIKVKLNTEGRYKVTENSWSWAYKVTPVKTYSKNDGKTVTGTNYVIRNVNKATEDTTEKGTIFKFTNTEDTNVPLHDEASKPNVFSADVFTYEAPTDPEIGKKN